MRLAVLLLLAAGCIIGDAPPGEGGGGGGGTAGGGGGGGGGGGDPGAPVPGPVPTNGYRVDVDLAARFPLAPLGTRGAGGAIALAPGTAASHASAAGRSLLKYLAACALPAGEALVAGAARYEGQFGLAPSWADAPCDLACQRWVSACLLAHANADGTPFPISPRGDHPGLAAGHARIEEFTYQEAAYYGNVFRRELYACSGADTLHASDNDAARYLNGRVCGALGAGTCGLVATGFCHEIAPGNPLATRACAHQDLDGTGFADCHTGTFAGDIPRTSPTVREVITVYLRP